MDTTPLLHAVTSLPGSNVMSDHPAFLRASHSPWRCIPQHALVTLRGIVLAYMAASSAMVGYYKMTEETPHPRTEMLFSFSAISWTLALSYHLVTFCWTYTHLYHPDPEDNEGGIEGLILKFMSLPRNMGSLRKQFYFTMFYTTSTVFAFMNSLIYWFITRAHNADAASSAVPTHSEDVVLWGELSLPIPDTPLSDLFGVGWFKTFVIYNIYCAPTVVMVMETLFFNSIKRPFALGSHIFGLMGLSGLYLGWAGVGKAMTGCYPFYWMSTDEMGSVEAVTVCCTGFVLLAPIMYTLMQGFVGVREGFTRARSPREVGHDLLGR